MINALGLDPKDQEIDLKDLRYGKIIIMTDADVDGSHIRALLLTFFNNKPFNKLIENGHVYLAQPPLFKINKGSKGIYIKDEKELEDYLISHNDKFKKLKKGSKEFMKEIDSEKHNDKDNLDLVWGKSNNFIPIWGNSENEFQAKHEANLEKIWGKIN